MAPARTPTACTPLRPTIAIPRCMGPQLLDPIPTAYARALPARSAASRHLVTPAGNGGSETGRCRRSMLGSCEARGDRHAGRRHSTAATAGGRGPHVTPHKRLPGDAHGAVLRRCGVREPATTASAAAALLGLRHALCLMRAPHAHPSWELRQRRRGGAARARPPGRGQVVPAERPRAAGQGRVHRRCVSASNGRLAGCAGLGCEARVWDQPCHRLGPQPVGRPLQHGTRDTA